MDFMQGYDAERISDFADEGDLTPIITVIGCAGCDEEVVERQGDLCGYCTEERNDIAAMAFIETQALQVNTDEALRWLTRALLRVAGGRWHLRPLRRAEVA